MSMETQKPSPKEWLEWAQVIVDRLTTCVHTYSKPPYDDVFIIEKERQTKNETTLNLLRRVYAVADELELANSSQQESLIAQCVPLIREALELLPTLSHDMQKLLKSEWFDKCNGRIASELFRGPMGELLHGIGSGYAEQGRLPEVLASLLERERIGDARTTRKTLQATEDSDKNSSQDDGPQRHIPIMKRRYPDGSGAV